MPAVGRRRGGGATSPCRRASYGEGPYMTPMGGRFQNSLPPGAVARYFGTRNLRAAVVAITLAGSAQDGSERAIRGPCLNCRKKKWRNHRNLKLLESRGELARPGSSDGYIIKAPSAQYQSLLANDPAPIGGHCSRNTF
jgi:hypothetical protein